MQYKFPYSVSIGLFEGLLWLISPFFPKAGKMLAGRRQTLSRVLEFRKKNPEKKVYWFHSASVGEFEQALPVIGLLKEMQGDAAIAVSFYSPSGMEMRGNHPLADLTFYIPADLKGRMENLLEVLKPEALVLVKYEFGYNLLSACKQAGIPAISICCILRESALKNPILGFHLRKCLPLFSFIFVQNSETARLLKIIGNQAFQINGDTRVDRVMEIRDNAEKVDWIPEWKEGHKLLIVGSAWAEDIVFLREFIRHSVIEADGLWRVLIVPHEIGETQIKHLTSSLGLPFELFSEWELEKENTDILVLDTLGLLSRTYRYADAAWIGGGFKTGLHNTLEAAVYGIPVGFGPNFKKFREAQDLQDIGLAKSFPAGGSVWSFFQSSTENPEEADKIKISAELYFNSQKGASEAIVQFLCKADKEA